MIIPGTGFWCQSNRDGHVPRTDCAARSVTPPAWEAHRHNMEGEMLDTELQYVSLLVSQLTRSRNTTTPWPVGQSRRSFPSEYSLPVTEQLLPRKHGPLP